MRVNTVQPEGKSSPLCMLHHDLLLLCGYKQSSKRQKQKVVTRPAMRAYPAEEGMQESESVSEYQSEEEQIPCHEPGRTLGFEIQIIAGLEQLSCVREVAPDFKNVPT